MPLDAERIRRELARLTPGAVEVLKAGFKQISDLDSEVREAITRRMVRGFGRDNDELNAEEFALEYKVSPSAARDMTFAFSMLIATIANGAEPAGEFLSVGVATELFTLDTARALESVALAVEVARPEITEAIELSNLGSSVLPSLETFNTIVDLRLGFEKDQIVRSVPVLIIHIDTDSLNNELRVQLTQRQAERMLVALQEGVRKLELAAQWTSERSVVADVAS